MRRRILKFVGIGVAALVAFVVFTFVVMSLWNWIIPPVVGWHPITFWQALGLLVLSKILFGGFWRGSGRYHWRRRMMERWEQMTPEEREKFREGMRSHCGSFRSAATEQKI